MLIPLWAKAAAVLALGAAVYGWGRHDGAAPVEAKLERERTERKA